MMSGEDDIDGGDDWAAALQEQADTAGEGDAAADLDMSQHQMDPLTDDRSDYVPGEDVKLDAILDIPVYISMEIGRTQISIRNLLKLNQGSVVELDRLAGEPMDVLVNGALIARGEVVVVNEKFGLRLTDIITPAERVKTLR